MVVVVVMSEEQNDDLFPSSAGEAPAGVVEADGGGEASESENSSSSSSTNTSSSSSSDDPATTNWLQALLARTLKLRGLARAEGDGEASVAPAPRSPLIEPLDMTGIAEYINMGKCKNVIVMSGAGISTSAGIPDFRSPGTGLYNNLQRFDLPHPQAIFEISFFRENPQPFFVLAKELYPGQFKPTPAHYFVRLLQDKGLLLRNYTQNIDTLERIAGVMEEKLIEAHGTFHTGHCIDCQAQYTQEWMREEIFVDRVPTCVTCNGVVKPDIVFFGESLPRKFHDMAAEDFHLCDLLLVMGTSLAVQPFASLVDRVPESCPRMLINKERSGENVAHPIMALLGITGGFDFDEETNYRDVFCKDTCDDGCQKLADLCGWGEEFRDLIRCEYEKIGQAGPSLAHHTPAAAAADLHDSTQPQTLHHPMPHVDTPKPHAGHSLSHVDHPMPHVNNHHPTPHLDHPTPHLDHPSPHLDHPTPHLDHPSPHLDHPSPHLDHPSPHLDHPTPHLDHPMPHVDHPAPNVDHPVPNADHPMPHVDHHHPIPHLDHPIPHVNHSAPHLDHPVPHLNHRAPHLDHPTPHLNHPTPHLNHPVPHIHHTSVEDEHEGMEHDPSDMTEDHHMAP